jgi:hypothetical protein
MFHNFDGIRAYVPNYATYVQLDMVTSFRSVGFKLPASQTVCSAIRWQHGHS